MMRREFIFGLVILGVAAILLVVFLGSKKFIKPQTETGEKLANIITEQDFTGDGTLDLKADNGLMWIQMNRDEGGGVGGFIDAGGISGQENFLGSPVFSGGMVNQADYWKLTSINVEIIENSPQKGSYKVTRVDTADGKEVTKELTVTLEASKEYAEIAYHYTNTGSTTWTFDEHPGHMHDGAHLVSVESAEHTDIDGYINGVGVIGLTSLGWWRVDTPDQTAPFFTLFKPSSGDAVTFGFKPPWSYAVHQMVAYYTGATSEIYPKVEPMATEFTLSPGASAQWKALIAFHTGGYTKGTQIYQGATQ